MDDVKLKNKVTLKRKGDSVKPPPPSKSKWWVWLLIGALLIIGIVLVVKYNSSTGMDNSVSEKVVQATDNKTEAGLQDSTAKNDTLQKKVERAKEVISETEKSTKSEQNKQSIAEAQAKVDKVVEEDGNVSKVKENAKSQTSNVNTNTVGTENINKKSSKQNNNSTSKPINSTKTDSKASSKASVQAKTDTPTTVKVNSAQLAESTIEEKAKRVIMGAFGNGIERKNALGDEYREIQNKVNEMHRNGVF